MIHERTINLERNEKKYPDEWLLIVDYEEDKRGQVLSGIVSRHSKEDSEVFCLPAVDNKDCAFKYTGKSNFLKVYVSHFEKSWGIKALIGLDFFRYFRVTIDYKAGHLITEPL